MEEDLKSHLKTIANGYDLTVEQHKQGIDPYASLPEKLKSMVEEIHESESPLCCSSNYSGYKVFLQPKTGDRFLDLGCCANLFNYGLESWPSKYYGVDISEKLISAMKGYTKRKGISIGGLFVSDASQLPFKNAFFDIAACIGVLEYYDDSYIKLVLNELYRVLKPGSRAVLDIPNEEHSQFQSMMEIEEHLGRPSIAYIGATFNRTIFENNLKKFFSIERVDDQAIMLKYYLFARL